MAFSPGSEAPRERTSSALTSWPLFWIAARRTPQCRRRHSLDAARVDPDAEALLHDRSEGRRRHCGGLRAGIQNKGHDVSAELVRSLGASLPGEKAIQPRAGKR